MRNKFVFIRCVFIVWLLCGVSYTWSVASAYDRTSPSASWGYQPLHSMASGGYTNQRTCSPTYTPFRTNTKPNYNFRSTSVYINYFDRNENRMMIVRNTPLYESGDDDDFPDVEEDDYPIGTVPEEEVPLGEPFVLIAFALMYLCYRFQKNLKQKNRSV